MKSHRRYLTLVILSTIHCFVFGQTKSLSNAYLAKQFGNYENKDASFTHLNYFAEMAERMHLSEQSEMVLSAAIKGENGYVHYKYKQFYAGVPIFGNTYFLHEKDGVVAKAGGLYSPQVIQSTKPFFDATAALMKAQQAMGAAKYAAEKTEPILCFIDPVFPKTSETLVLAYQVDLNSLVPLDKQRIFIDAHTGKVVRSFPLIMHQGVPSTAKTKYYGTRNIITDSLGTQEFVLHDPTRGQGITVTEASGGYFTSTSSNWDLTNDAKDEVALDAHFCTQEFYDLMLEQFGWDGLDDNGAALNVRVHDSGAGAVNAYWDGQFTNYGDGNCLYGPLTTLEVVGHEFTHGVISYTSNLVYGGESGAINESVADMFGKILERNVDPSNFSWVLSHSFLLSPDATPFRVMNDPASLDMPDFYKGDLWENDADVHTNSSIGNLWFTMIVDGKQGVNEVGTAYNVPAIGIDKAGQIVFKVNTAYFTENSDYPAFAAYSVQAAEELYGVGSPEALAVAEAWVAVGVVGNTQPAGLNLSINTGYGYNQVCGLNNYIPITVQIVNNGDITYVPSMNAELTLVDGTGNLSDYHYTLTETLASGEVLNLEIDNWFLPVDATFYFISADLSLQDENTDDNFGYYFYDVVQFEANDMTIEVYITPQACFSSNLEAQVYLSNHSCETIPAGTTMTLSADDANGNQVWSMPYTLTNDLYGFQGVVVVAQMPQNTGSLEFKLIYANESAYENNVYSLDSPEMLPIVTDYLNEFNTDLTGDNVLDINSIVESPLIDYNGESYFGSTGYESDPENLTHCPEYIDNFNNNDVLSGVNSTIRACVDYSTASSSQLEFDLVLFKSQYAANNNYDYSSMLQASWSGTANGSEIIYDQPDGTEQHHTYSLPPFFKGELLLKFYTELGQWEADPINFDSDDFVLMDNLQLRANSTGTFEKELDQSLTISPNPAKDLATLQSTEKLKTVIIGNACGQILFRAADISQYSFDLDMSGLQTGFYFVNVELENGQWLVQKLVKMD